MPDINMHKMLGNEKMLPNLRDCHDYANFSSLSKQLAALNPCKTFRTGQHAPSGFGDNFDHFNMTFRVVQQSPKPEDLLSGVWVRICFNPFDGKKDIIGTVISCDRFWPIIHDRLGDDYRVLIARNDDKNDHYQILFSEEYLEIIEPLTPIQSDNFENTCWSGSGYGKRGHMNIIVCLDGTWNQNETQNTNVHRIFELVDKNYSICNYYSGVGIWGRHVSNLLDAMSGRGVFKTVRSAYTFIRGNYQEGDRIFIFGFSRGAYAARHLAGMITRIGIHSHVEQGFEEYVESFIKGPVQKPNGRNHDVHFLGMFDCVPGNQLYTIGRSEDMINNPELESNIRNAAHAVARDERRWSFKPLIFKKNNQLKFNQAWFPGFHFDVGGDQNNPLNNFALVWMLDRAKECGLILSDPIIHQIDPSAQGHQSDWITTKLGLICSRKFLPDANLISAQPDLLHLRSYRLLTNDSIG